MASFMIAIITGTSMKAWAHCQRDILLRRTLCFWHFFKTESKNKFSHLIGFNDI